jgi:hypothetical protein
MNQISTNIGAFVTTLFALQRTAFGVGVGNLAATDGEAFNRTAKRPLHLSGKLVIGYKATIPSGQSLTINNVMKDSPDGVTYTGLVGGSGATTIQGLHTGAEQKGTVEVDFNLIGASDYIRPTVSATLTASGSSVAEVFGALVIGGGETIPAGPLTDVD